MIEEVIEEVIEGGIKEKGVIGVLRVLKGVAEYWGFLNRQNRI